MRHVISTFKGGDQLRSTVKVHERELERWIDELRRMQLGVGRDVIMPSSEADWGVRYQDILPLSQIYEN